MHFPGRRPPTRRHQIAPAIGAVFGFHLLKDDAGELAVVVSESLWHHEVEDRNILMKGVFLFPRARLHFFKAGTHDHLDVFAAKTARGAAAIHRGIAAAKHDHALADLAGMLERNRSEPVDADVNILGGFLAARNFKFAAARRAGADEHRIVIFGKKTLQAVDALAALELDAEIEDVVGFLIDHRIRQPEFRNLGSHHAAGFAVGIEHRAVIAERREIPRHRQRGGATADNRDALAVFRRKLRHPVLDVVLEVGGDALQSANGDRGILDPATPAGRFARTITGASENSRKHIGAPIDHIGVAITTLGDQSDVFGDGCVRGAGPLAVDDFVKVVRGRDISRFHSYRFRAQSNCRAAFSFT
jgi:hypothetical protein